MARGTVPAITWGAAFVNTLELGYPLDMSVAWSDPRPGSEFGRAPSGERDAWVTGHQPHLAGNWRYIPTANGTTPTGIPITGWDGATGVEAFLEWARQMNPFRYVADRTSMGTWILSYLVEPMEGQPQLEQSDMTRTLSLIIENASSSYTGY